jgi:hypothetical protein
MKDWVTSEKNLWDVDELLGKAKHHRIYTTSQKKHIRNATKIERSAAGVIEWKRSDPRT